MRYLVLLVVCVVSTVGLAEPPEDKLDAILKELRAMSQRIDILEARIRAIDKQLQRAAPATEPVGGLPRDPYRAAPLPIGMRPQDVLRMQIEEPGSLMKNIHDRERVLRSRVFPADIIPSPLY